MQKTVTWHVHDFKVSHINPSTNTQLMGSFAKIYENKITVPYKKVHDYLGMDLNMSEEGVAGTYMIKYLKKILIL